MMKRTISERLSWCLAAFFLISSQPAQTTEIKPGTPAPGFTLKSANGTNLSLREYRGQVVMINFWATWCSPCRQEMPELNALYEKYRPAGFVLIGVNVDAEPANAVRMADKLGVAYPVLFDTDKKTSTLYQVSAMPMTVLVDRDGNINYLKKGYRAGYEYEYHAIIRSLLKQ